MTLSTLLVASAAKEGSQESLQKYLFLNPSKTNQPDARPETIEAFPVKPEEQGRPKS